MDTRGGAADASGLLRYLRDLARARRAPARGGARRERVHWLAELPGDVYVETDAGPGDVLFSVPLIPLTPPAVLEEFDGWLALRHWYRTLRELAELSSGGHEVVLAAGLLSWRPGDGPPVRGHLLATPVDVAVDERTERVDVVLAGPTTLRDRELLTGAPGFRAGHADRVRDAVRAGRGFGLGASVCAVLRAWGTAAFAGGVPVHAEWPPDDPVAPPPEPRVRLAPALVVRPPGRTALADHYERLLAQGATSRGLARLLDPSLGGRPLMHVPERAPDTVADLLAGLLARGRRALVACADERAARRLLTGLPAGLAGLCAGAGEGDRVAEALAARAAGHDPSRHRRHIADLEQRRDDAARTAAELRERLAVTLAADRCDLAPGYRGTRAEVERRIAAEAADHSWLPPRPGLPAEPPLTAAEAAELVGLIAAETPARRARPAQRDVDPGALPSPAYVRTLIDEEAKARARAEEAETGLSRRLREVDVATLARLDACATAVTATLRDLGLGEDPGDWDAGDQAVRAFTDALARRRTAAWARVAALAARAEEAARAAAATAGRRVVPPPGDPREMADAAEGLRRYLADGGVLKRGPLRPAPQRRAEPLLSGARVDGRAPDTPDRLAVLCAHLEALAACRELQQAWEATGAAFATDAPPHERLARFHRAHERVARIRAALPALEETAALLDGAGLDVPLHRPELWHEYLTGLRSALLGVDAGRATADLTALRDSIPRGEDDPPELRAALAALDDRDAAAYARALDDLAAARRERELQVRCEELLGRVRAVHPGLADALAATARDAAWTERAARWDEAWTWAHVSGRLAEHARSPAETRVRQALAEAETRHRDLDAELLAARAWGAALARPHLVPAWVLPLWDVPDALAPEPDAFDAVIIDGEHGAGAEALFLLWHAPRVILVGESGPPLPMPDGAPPVSDLPAGLREVVSPTAPLFTVLLDALGGRPRQAAEPPAAPAAPSPAAPPPAAPSTRTGRSIATYKRRELVELIGRIARQDPDLTDDRLIAVARARLACPPDEHDLVQARLRFALDVHRGLHRGTDAP